MKTLTNWHTIHEDNPLDELWFDLYRPLAFKLSPQKKLLNLRIGHKLYESPWY